MSEPTESSRSRRVRLNNLREAALNEAAGTRSASPDAHWSHRFSGRWTRRDWAHASLFATLGALVTAIVPGFSSAMQAPAHVGHATMSLSLPPLSRAKARGVSGDSWQVVSVARGQTLGDVFEAQGIPASDLHALLDHPGVKSSLTRLKPGTEVAFDMPVPADGAPALLRTFRYDRDDSHRIELALARDASGKPSVTEKVIERPLETRTAVLSGKVGRSLYKSARKVGLTGANIDTLTDDIFKYDIDFNSDVGADDRFSVVVEQTWREGELLRTGPVLAATFTTGRELHSGFRYVRNGKPEYFTGDGRPLKRSFIRMPIPYARISSGFGMRRHPVLGHMRGHMGIDYRAGSGTPIMAAGDARVAFMGWKGGYGRAVILDHGRGYTTLYGHMSAFGNIKQGQRIAQGTMIGRVGSTGMSTGPHLHYEFRINGVHRNPLSVTMPPPEPLRGTELAQFRAQVGPALARIQTVERIIYADVPAAPASQDTRVAAFAKALAKASSKKG